MNKTLKGVLITIGILVGIVIILFLGVIIWAMIQVLINPPTLEQTNISQTNETGGVLETRESKEGNTTLLHITEKEWYITLNLSGFEDVPYQIYLDQFLFRQKDSVTISIFADKIPDVNDAASCKEANVPYVKAYMENESSTLSDIFTVGNLVEEERPGQLIIYFDENFTEETCKAHSEFCGARRSLNYYDYYDGYCFDFHISGDVTAKDLTRIEDILKSITLVTPEV